MLPVSYVETALVYPLSFAYCIPSLALLAGVNPSHPLQVVPTWVRMVLIIVVMFASVVASSM